MHLQHFKQSLTSSALFLGNPYYEDFCKYIKQGWKEGWVATGDLDRGIYKRSKVRPITVSLEPQQAWLTCPQIQLPLADNLYMS